ncbi:hypothetical protein [Streptomyces shenzhenensis]|uniref:hypothetical protein n=1 Tax=Streptomyces shenzhenensis TaxID=943815 RepID=UPI0033D7F235
MEVGDLSSWVGAGIAVGAAAVAIWQGWSAREQCAACRSMPSLPASVGGFSDLIDIAEHTLAEDLYQSGAAASSR